VSVESDIRRYIEHDLLDGVSSPDPLAEGLLDSLAVEQLITHLERSFGIAFEDGELVAENFASIETLASLIRTKRGDPR
jgi:acyl carrier protein